MLFQISSLRSRLEKSDKELERASVGRVEAERCKALVLLFLTCSQLPVSSSFLSQTKIMSALLVPVSWAQLH